MEISEKSLLLVFSRFNNINTLTKNLWDLDLGLA